MAFRWISLLLILCVKLAFISSKSISLSFPISVETLRNADSSAIFNKVAKTGCWINFIGNFKFGWGDPSEIQFPAQFSTSSQNSPIPIPIPLLLNSKNYELMSKKVKTLGLTFISRSKYSFCFISVLYWPNAGEIFKPVVEEPVVKTSKGKPPKKKDALIQIKKYFGHSLLKVVNVENSVGSVPTFLSKWTLVFLAHPIAIQNKAQGPGGNLPLLLKYGEQIFNYAHTKYYKPSSPYWNDFELIFPLTVLMVSGKPRQKVVKVLKVQNNPSLIKTRDADPPKEMEIIGIWSISHLTFMMQKMETEDPCSRTLTESSSSSSCYIQITPTPSKHQIFDLASSKDAWSRTPSHKTNPTNLQQTMSNFLTLVTNDTFGVKGVSGGNDFWTSSKLNVQVYNQVAGAGLLIFTGVQEFKFITSQNVKSLKNTLEIYTTPFQKQAWIFFVNLMMISTFVLVGLSWIRRKGDPSTISTTSKKLKTWETVSELTMWIIRILLEQVDEEIPRGIQTQIHQNFTKEYQRNGLKRSFRIVLGVWLLMSIILVNGYRGIIKSDYIKDFPFVSRPRWNSSLDFQKDGSFFVYYSETDFPCKHEKFIHTMDTDYFNISISHPAVPTPIHLQSMKVHFLEYHESLRTCKKNCSVQNMSLPFEASGCGKFEACRKVYRHLLVSLHLNFTCTANLSTLIKNVLRQPKPNIKSVFMTTRQDFPFYWNLFKREMKENRKLKMKFIHNGDDSDDAVTLITGFKIKFGVAKDHRDLILQPLKLLMTSGIFWWWEKWDEIIFHKHRQVWRNPTEYIDESVPVFKPLSFVDSEIHLVFLIWFFSLILPAAALLIEMKMAVIRKAFLRIRQIPFGNFVYLK